MRNDTDIIKGLNLNKDPKGVPNGSLIFAKNIKLDDDGVNLTNEEGFIDLEKSILLLSALAGVPVLNRNISTPFAFKESVRCVAACSPFGPVALLTSP